MAEQPRCDTCKFWLQDVPLPKGECHRSPPILLSFMVRMGEYGWPRNCDG